MFNPISTVTNYLGLTGGAPQQTAPSESKSTMAFDQGYGQLNPIGTNGFQLDTATGNIVNPLTGQVVQGPNMPQLAAQENMNAQQQFQQEQQARLGLLGTIANQGGLLKQEQQIAQNPNSSLAAMQMQEGLGQAQAQQQAAVSGATGANSVLAQRDAAQNGAALDAATNNQAAQLRAQEVQQSLANQGGILGTIGGEQGGIMSSQGSQSLQGQNLAGQNEQTMAGLAQKQQQANQQTTSNVLGTMGTALASGMGM